MYCDIPEWKRCCFCLPLRYGLIGYGYLKLVALLTTLILNGQVMFSYFIENFIITILLILIFADIILTAVFVYGGHAKNAKILLVYMWYCILCTVAYVVLQIISVLLTRYEFRSHNFVMQVVLSSLVVTFFQAYLVFSIRSEIIKLLKNREESVHFQGAANPLQDA